MNENQKDRSALDRFQIANSALNTFRLPPPPDYLHVADEDHVMDTHFHNQLHEDRVQGFLCNDQILLVKGLCAGLFDRPVEENKADLRFEDQNDMIALYPQLPKNCQHTNVCQCPPLDAPEEESSSRFARQICVKFNAMIDVVINQHKTQMLHPRIYIFVVLITLIPVCACICRSLLVESAIASGVEAHKQDIAGQWSIVLLMQWVPRKIERHSDL